MLLFSIALGISCIHTASCSTMTDLRCSTTTTTTVKDALLCSDYKRDSEVMSSISYYWPAASECKYIQSLCIQISLSVKQCSPFTSTVHQDLVTSCFTYSIEIGVQCNSTGSSCLLTWQPAFSSICAYFTVLSISGKTRILHVMGTESFSLASKTGKDWKDR